uniref:Cytidine deaminase n=1 Tax=candidate division WOR-3 bacterium TaxID=2052148 RepID=A0A7C4GCQ1_UNCW3
MNHPLIVAASAVRLKAFAPYSRFQVGAALEAEDGTIIVGCNVESASYGLTLCAERVAICKGISEGFRCFKQVAIVTDTPQPTPPCGACRQLLWEFAPPFYGAGSTPAVSREGITYVLVTAARRDVGEQDTLYAVGPNGERRWACGLGTGSSDEIMSAPKIDHSGYVYVGSGPRAWCIVGLGGPATSSWPMYMRDAQNSGRAR